MNLSNENHDSLRHNIYFEKKNIDDNIFKRNFSIKENKVNCKEIKSKYSIKQIYKDESYDNYTSIFKHDHGMKLLIC